MNLKYQITPNQLRKKYLDFFSDKIRQHVIIPSSPLVPENDPTTLFTGSGMQPMIEYLLGQPHPKGKKIADSQKCFRSQDIEDVGDNRHTTFFEMLGNWSLGDYFKEEQLTWFFEFLTQEVGLDPERLYVTVFSGNSALNIGKDSESIQIWQNLFSSVGVEALVVENAEQKGLQEGRIFSYGEKKNWWSRSGEPKNMPAGEPGGPDSEVFYDFGHELGLHEQSEWKKLPCHVNCDCGRFLEIGNSVFMQYQKQADGSFAELPQKNVDFGGGFERILAASANQIDIFKTEIFLPIINYLENLSQKKYEDSEEIRRSFRVIADHVRAGVMLAGDGVFPSNKEQGYFSRRLLRRAIRYGKMIGIDQQFLKDIVPVVADIYQNIYPEISENLIKIQEIFSIEEKKFGKSIEKGLHELEKFVNDTQEFSSELAFKLFETYGFPLELSLEEAKARNLKISTQIEKEFLDLKLTHASKSRSASEGKFKGGLADSSEISTKYHTATHLIHSALRKILGDRVEQKGSNITGERLRFDFSHPQAMTEAEIASVEKLVNQWIELSLPVTQKNMAKNQALSEGALAFFVEKYPDQVSVYTIGNEPTGKNNSKSGNYEEGWISKELCGGPHVKNTKEIGRIKIQKEKASSAGVRRIYAQLA